MHNREGEEWIAVSERRVDGKPTKHKKMRGVVCLHYFALLLMHSCVGFQRMVTQAAEVRLLSMHTAAVVPGDYKETTVSSTC